MKIIMITGYKCIFDNDDCTFNLSVLTRDNGYKMLVYTAGKNKSKSYARVKLNLVGDKEVDHENGNTLDNRRSNIRVCIHQQNLFNRAVSIKKKSKLPKGVSRNRDKFRAEIMNNYIKYSLGTYDTVRQAEIAYKTKAKELQGKYATHLSRN